MFKLKLKSIGRVNVGSQEPMVTAIFFMVVLVGVVFFRAIYFDFINFDDNVYVTANPHVSSGLSWANTLWAFTTTTGGHWHPLTWLSHQLDSQLFGLNSGAHHTVNLLFHLLNTILLFFLLYRLFGNLVLAWWMAALFSLHPLRIESVAWVSERKDVLSLFFGLLMMLMYIRFSVSRKARDYGYLLLFFILGLLAKPSLVVLPVLLLLMDFWPLKTMDRSNVAERSVAMTPFFIISFLSSLITLWAQKQEGALGTLHSFSLLDRFNTACVGYLTYLGKTIWPDKLSVFYPFEHHSLTVGVMAFVILFCISIFVFYNRIKFPWLFFAWIWFVLALFPVIGLLQVGGQALANRWTYLPHIGLAIALCGFASLLKPRMQKMTGFILGILLVFFTVKTEIELEYWKNSETLFSHALQINPDNFLAHTNLADALRAQGDIDGAFYHNKEALRSNPHYPEALNNLGNMKARLGFFDEAISFFEQALEGAPRRVEIRYNLALAHYGSGQKARAIGEWAALLRSNPDYRPAYKSLNYAVKHDFETLCIQAKSKKLDENDQQFLRQTLSLWKTDNDFTSSILFLSSCLSPP